MFRDMNKFGKDPETVVRSSVRTFNRPLVWQRDAEKANTRELVMSASWSDFFIKEADPWRDEAWAIIKRCPNLTFQIFTKRASRMKNCLPADWGDGYPNVWIGVSVESQDVANSRVPILLDMKAKTKFISYEPALEYVDFTRIKPNFSETTINSLVPGGLDWIIAGGESGDEDESRFFDPEWSRDLLRQRNGTANSPTKIFIKQMGSVWARANNALNDHGANPLEWDEDLRVQELADGFVGSPVMVNTDEEELIEL
jgi:protein gp37